MSIRFLQQTVSISKDYCRTDGRHSFLYYFFGRLFFKRRFPYIDPESYYNNCICPKDTTVPNHLDFAKQQQLAEDTLQSYTFIGDLVKINRKKRNKRYADAFNMGEGCTIEYNVLIRRRHPIGRTIVSFGNRVKLSHDVDLDYTGELVVGNNVNISQGVVILTHGHDFLGFKKDEDLLEKETRIYPSPLIIEDNVDIGLGSIVLPGVNKIGKNAIIAAGSVVVKEVLPNTIVSGNPAVELGSFPDEMKVFNGVVESK